MKEIPGFPFPGSIQKPYHLINSHGLSYPILPPLHDAADALIILVIVFISGALGFWQERGAHRAVEKMLPMVPVKAIAFLDSASEEIPLKYVCNKVEGVK